MSVQLFSVRGWWCLMFWLGCWCSVTMPGSDIYNNEGIESRHFPRTISPDAARLFDANNISVYIQNNGNFAHDPMTGQSGFFFPKSD